MPKQLKNFTFPRRLIHLARRLLEQPQELGDVAQQAEKRTLESKSRLDEVWDDFQTMIRMVRAWSSGTYREIPKESILKIVFAILYFLLLIDVIPDFIPGLGLVDDVSVILWTLRSIQSEIQKFRAWESVLSKDLKTNSDSQT